MPVGIARQFNKLTPDPSDKSVGACPYGINAKVMGSHISNRGSLKNMLRDNAHGHAP